jgi:hypothetical protein
LADGFSPIRSRRVSELVTRNQHRRAGRLPFKASNALAN